MRSEAASLDDSGRSAGRYTILERIGAGGAAVVHRARDEVSGRIVAFKQVLRAKMGARAKAAEALFEREYRTLVRLKHPRIIQVYDYGVTAEGPYYTMELLEGSDLVQLRELPYVDACRHLRDVASSLALLHAQRFVHRDVSPRNIRLTSDGTARLLDFGALAPFGPSTDVVGTPPFMAPEVLHELPLDPRTDLYSLGAVGYYCLTGRLPFAARHVSELPRLWQTPPLPPSAFVPDIPPQLDRLILSMLSQDPLGRPETAAAVIDQLTVIASLPPEPHERAEQSYFLSSPIVGRATQIDWVLGRIDLALQGKGGEVVIEGAAGIGKTRLANELCLAGTLKGTVSLKVDAESTRTSFGVAAALAGKLLETCPEVARRTAEPHADVLRRLAPELADAFGGVDSGTLSDPSERRVRAHAAIREWFLAVSRERTLLVCVDNGHALDDDSASFLAALGRESRTAPILVLTTLRTGSPVVAKETIRLVHERAQPLKLSALDAKACEQLASGLFGGAANAGRVGSLLLERSGGVPRQFVELAQLMVQKKIAKYEAGGWVLPLHVADGELPAHAEELLAARLSGLGPDAVALARTLAVHSGSVSLAVAVAVSDLPGEGRVYAVLDELLAEQVLAIEGGGYRFRHEALRDAVLSRMDPEARRRSQLRAAETLLAFEASGVTDRVEAALLLVEAGEENRGARILVTAAREFAAGAGTHQNPDRLVRALCRMVRAYDEQERSEYEISALLFPLMPLAYYSANWQFMLEYGERAIEMGMRITGLARAGELVSELAPEEAMKRGLGAGAAGFAQQPADLGYDLKTAIAATIGMVPSIVAVYATCLDAEAVSRIARAVAPLALFGEAHVASAMQLFAEAEVLITEGSESQSTPLWERALARFEHPSCVAAIGEARAKTLQQGVQFALGILGCYQFGESALARAARINDLGVKAWSAAADQIRILYHALRGESVEVKACMDRVELNAIQGAQSWQVEVFWPALLLNADVLIGDAMAARRRFVQLERRSQDISSLKPQAEAARAAYLMLRGDVRAATGLYEKLLPSFPIRKRVGWETTRAYFARTLNAAGAHARAKAIAGEVLSNMVPSDHDHVGHFLEAQRQLALAESGLGNHAGAAAMLDALLAKHGRESNPLLVGLLHQARAEVAERAKDQVAAEEHRTEMERRFRSTQNPLLIAQCERARRRSPSTGNIRASSDAGEHAPLQPVPNTVSTFVGGAAMRSLPSSASEPARLEEAVAGSDEPLETALTFVMRRAKAKGAYLYVPGGNSLQLAWSSNNEEPPHACVAELARWIDVVRENDRHDAAQHARTAVTIETVTVSGFRMVALRGANDGGVVGALVLEIESGVEFGNTSQFFDALGRVVEEHGQQVLELITA